MSKTGFYKGRLGIGLTSTMGMGDGNPRFPLDINGDIRLTGAIVNGDGLALNMVNPDSAWVVDAANNKISYSAGNVGIGTQSPQTKLHVETTITANDTTVPMDSDALNNTVGLYLSNRYSASFNYGVILGALVNATGYIQSISNDGNGRNLVLNPGGGNVGIGTINPIGKLHVYKHGAGENDPGGEIILSRYHTDTTTGLYGGIIWTEYIGPNSSCLCFSAQHGGNVTYTEQMVLTHGGNVGIGTTGPDQILHLAKTASSNNYLRFTPTEYSEVDGWDIGLTAYNTYTTSGYDFILKKLRSGTTGNVLIPDGNVGIGTTSPSEKLDIEGHGGNGTGRIRFTDTDADSNSRNWFMGPYCSNDAAFQIIPSATKGGTSPDTTKTFCIEYTGNVGIGTTNPGAPLEIYKKGHNTDEKGGAIILSRFVQGQDGVTANAGDPYRGSCIWHEYTDGNDCMMFASSSNANPYTLSPSMVLTNQGNVGIGTTTPDNLLHLKGSYPIQVEHQSNSTLKLFIDYNQIHTEGNNNLYLNYNSQKDVIICGQGGNVGIGTTSPDNKLEVYSSHSNHSNTSALTDGSYGAGCVNLDVVNGFGGYGGGQNYHRSAIRFYHSNQSGHGVRQQTAIISQASHSNNHDGSNMFFLTRAYGSAYGDGNGALGESMALRYDRWLHVVGSVYADGTTLSSDDRVKHNEKNVTNALDSINKLKLKKYIKTQEMYDKNHNFPLDDNEKPLDNSGNSLQYKSDYFIEVGFIAQDVRNITEFAEFVNGEEYEEKIIQEFEKDPSGEPILDESGNIIVINTSKKQVPTKLSLNYNNLFCYHIQATQELDRKVIALESENAELETKNTDLENKIATLESELAAIKQHLGI